MCTLVARYSWEHHDIRPPSILNRYLHTIDAVIVPWLAAPDYDRPSQYRVYMFSSACTHLVKDYWPRVVFELYSCLRLFKGQPQLIFRERWRTRYSLASLRHSGAHYVVIVNSVGLLLARIVCSWTQVPDRFHKVDNMSSNHAPSRQSQFTANSSFCGI